MKMMLSLCLRSSEDTKEAESPACHVACDVRDNSLAGLCTRSGRLSSLCDCDTPYTNIQIQSSSTHRITEASRLRTHYSHNHRNEVLSGAPLGPRISRRCDGKGPDATSHHLIPQVSTLHITTALWRERWFGECYCTIYC
jgi:hypothetical protein